MSSGGQFKRGLGFGAGFAVSWVLVLFVGIPLLFIGGCALMVGAGSIADGGGKPHSTPVLSAHDGLVLSRRAMRDVRYHWAPQYRVRSAACRFQRIDTAGPDSWNYSCVTTTISRKGGRVVRFREVIPCFTAPPYVTTENCDTSGVTPSRLRS